MTVAIDADTADSTKDQFADAFEVEGGETARDASSGPSECICDADTYWTAYPTVEFC